MIQEFLYLYGIEDKVVDVSVHKTWQAIHRPYKTSHPTNAICVMYETTFIQSH